jgi:hypothetical protein
MKRGRDFWRMPQPIVRRNISKSAECKAISWDETNVAHKIDGCEGNGVIAN